MVNPIIRAILPSTGGKIERVVGTLKTMLKRAVLKVTLAKE